MKTDNRIYNTEKLAVLREIDHPAAEGFSLPDAGSFPGALILLIRSDGMHWGVSKEGNWIIHQNADVTPVSMVKEIRIFNQEMEWKYFWRMGRFTLRKVTQGKGEERKAIRIEMIIRGESFGASENGFSKLQASTGSESFVPVEIASGYLAVIETVNLLTIDAETGEYFFEDQIYTKLKTIKP